jgi:hypothetical protein
MFAVRKLFSYLKWLYFQYCIHLAVNTFEPWEVRIFNTLIVLMVCCTVYTTYIFMPGHIHMWIGVFRWASAAVAESMFGGGAGAFGSSTDASLQGAMSGAGGGGAADSGSS